MAMSSGIFLSKSNRARLAEFSKTAKDKREYRAALGVLLRADGKSAKEVGRRLDVTQKQVFVWCRKFKDAGTEGLKVRKQTGRPARAGDNAKGVIPKLLKQDPQAFGFLKGRWVLRDISRELKKEGIELHYTGVRRILNDLGIDLRQPKLRALGSLKKNYRKRREIANYRRIAPALLKKGLS